MDFYWYIILFVAIILKILFYLCWFYSRQRRLAAGPELAHGPTPGGTLSRPPPYPGMDGQDPPAGPVGSFPEPPPYCELEEHDGKPPPYHAVVALKEAQALQSQHALLQDDAPVSHDPPPDPSPQMSQNAHVQVVTTTTGVIDNNPPC
ncbi:PREDICTED: uncharacterized protein LOC109477680 [Branchiostoma belcheri]|uniref:Uncharacterized protein LOC109477680 n=1 Tax=Branchiostoma belcheri TaxID=7741 RepID=A0A6P4ZD22_BRABE|nr:PREDICTED: uncharacterized protein LOC109477680 [Branchiostoma belcheri]XP_019634583.1 PREDICTED: uncharacterized protein LOC109477680 [Branchiostoma belcheri]XP_019634584.1 PREDICTED: uncharacterized protein LOC109477680 [Branchiostoma belcheri]